MKYVYILKSKSRENTYYTGITDNVEVRLKRHNFGQSPHTIKSKPWELISYCAFVNKTQAYKFEKYLKSGSGRAFALKHLR